MELSGQITEIIKQLCEKFGVVIDFTKDNIIPYLQQLAIRIINYEINTSIAWMIIGGLIVIIGIIGLIASIKHEEELEDLKTLLNSRDFSREMKANI